MTSHSQSFLHTRIPPNMLSLVPWGMLNGTGCPKNQPAILDQTIFKLRILKLKTFSRKVQCSKDIIFMVVTSTQTSVSVLNSHKFVKYMSFSVSPKENHHPENKCSVQPTLTNEVYYRIPCGQEATSIQQIFMQWSLFKQLQVFELKS